MDMNVGELTELLEPEVNTLGYDLVDLELRLGGRSGLIRLFIDSEDGITLEDCERVSHQVSALLDVEDPIPGHYVLEVSSPGLNRRLRKPADFARFRGERAKVELAAPNEDGRRRFTGVLTSVDDDGFSIEVDGVAHRLTFDKVETARLAPEIKV
jgi:ribosome maturation factor RimP